MEKLEGRDVVNAHKISKKVNEIIDVLIEKEVIEKEEDKKEAVPE